MAKKYRTAADRAAERPWREREVLGPQEIADILLISRTAAYDLIREGQIPGRVPGIRSVRVSVPAFRRFLGELPEVPPRPKKGAA